MRHVVKIGLALLLGAGTLAGSQPAAAQVSIRIGDDRPRIERRIYREPRFIERHIVRHPPRRQVCTTKWRTTFTSHGAVPRRIVTCHYR